MNENNDLEKKTTSIHTLESDLASAVRDDNYGKNIIKIITDPNKNSMVASGAGGSSSNFDIKSLFSKRNIVIFFIVIILVAASGTILYILNQAKNVGVEPEDGTMPVTATTTPTNDTPVIKSSDVLNPEILQSSDFSKLNRFEIIGELTKIKNLLIEKKVTAGNNIAVGTNLTITQFFEKIRYSGDEAFLRSLDTIYAFGFYSIPNNKFETYLLIKINNFDLAFKSILDWEKYMIVDLKDIFIGNNESNAITSTTTEKKYSKKNTNVFVDKVLKNYDVREYINNENNEDIIYGFINNKYLLITSGESSFIDIKDRLLKENIPR